MPGKVAVIFQVYADAGKEEAVKKEIVEKLNPKGVQLEEVAFGIKIIKVMFINDDQAGTTDKEEAELRKISGVNEVEVIDESLL
ncbi:Elongation factor 1-beta [uncultured archaeon]|nr:Elongation factor 1-beta [uncultured archaeon]